MSTKVGILAEKPSAMRNFAKALGGESGNYKGQEYVIAASRGHLFQFMPPGDNVPSALKSKYGDWALSNLPWNETDFLWKKVKSKGATDVLKVIYSAFSDCDEICIATDDDESGEGQLLAWEVIEGIKMNVGKTYSRMYFSDESEKEVRKAFENRKPIASQATDMEYKKADFRSKFDYLSMQFTRIATFYGDGTSTLRQGRLKSAMVSIVGDGIEAVKNYKKIPSYQNRFRDENGIMYKDEDEPTFPKKEDVPQNYSSSPVIKDSSEVRHTAPPKLLDLASLSAILAPKGVKAQDVLAVYQKMYEDQIVSYPRTDDKKITLEQFNDLLPLVDKIASVVGVNPALLTHRTPRKTHIGDGMSHGANRPGTNVPASLDDLKSYGSCAPMIYEILARNFLAILCEDYEYTHEEGHLEKYPSFIGKANIPLKPGYKAIYSDEEEEEEENNGNLGLGTVADPFIFEFFPKKPPTPTWKWLKTQLEKYDVGTGATRTSTYADVTDANTRYPLLTDTKGKIGMTQYGQMSYMLLKGTHIGNITVTEELYSDMRSVEAGTADAMSLLHKMQQLVIDDMATMKNNSAPMKKALNVQPVVQKEKCVGIWNGKQISFTRIYGGHRFTDEECEALLKGNTISITIKSKKGTPIEIEGSLENQTYKGRKFIGFNGSIKEKPKTQTNWKCPSCGNLLMTNKDKLSCDCGLDIPWSLCRKKISDEDMKSILFDGATPRKIYGMYSEKKKKKFNAVIALSDDKKGITLVFD